MEVDSMKKLLEQTQDRRNIFNEKYSKSKHYYLNENDITIKNHGESKTKEDDASKESKNPLRPADNRISSNFHQLLVDQEAGYLATKPPTIDVDDDKLNQQIKNTLGDNFGLRLNELVVDAANAGIAWLHYWIDSDGQFRYGLVPPDQVTPIYSTDLNRKLVGLRRSYRELEPDTAKTYWVHEYWDEQTVTAFKSNDDQFSDLEAINDRFTIFDASTNEKMGTSSVNKHGLGRIPFIAFPKNKEQQPDLYHYKGLIDVYDKIYNGYVNDLDDIQQVFLILKNLDGQDLDDFRENLRRYKSIKIRSMGAGDDSGVDQLAIDIPTEARNSMLETTKTNIFVHAQGIDPTDFKTNNATGTAIKMLYSHLELKAAKTEAYFRDALTELVRAIMNWLHVPDADSRPIEQTWTRTAIQNNVEKAQVVSQLANWTSKEAIAKANPIVEDWQQELKDQQEDLKNRNDEYGNPDNLNGGDNNDDQERG
ncbi:phage portal protein [Lactobacillus sp. ESL0261]|uniref:phage portal protein n=1 Tax=Lactobacillus sp. ESL0261 TaxID=2069348 RepID=UPI000EFC381E|nr:phage portal protein [Lactobacillus sp. ESL0261]RMC55054.1 phage portal protein [Lactobacillus sp. ESL0261]